MPNLPADLPEDWTSNQKISPNGTEVGLSEQHGYNYLMKQVNDTQTEVNNIGTTIEAALEDVAKEASVQEVITTIGDTGDTGGSTVAGTVMAKNNREIELGEIAIQNLNNIESRLSGISTPYGTGMYGDLTFDSSTFTWPSQDYYNRYIVQVKSLTIPEGQTMKPPAKCDGLYILSQGDVTINGNIDVTGLRKTFGNVAISPTINVGDQEFQLAVGGYAPKGGANGRGGTVDNADYTRGNTPTPVQTIKDSISGNINGGGVGNYGIGGASVVLHYDDDESSRSDTDLNDYDCTINISERPRVYKNGPTTAYQYNAPGSVVIIAKSNVIINGSILASATAGKEPTVGSGSTLYVAREVYTGNWMFSVSGDGAIPPSGGGAVTIICNDIICNGEIDTNGKKLVSADKPDLRNSYVTSLQSFSYSTGKPTGDINYNPSSSAWNQARNNVHCSEGGKGGTFISTAGEIKVYTGVSE